LPLPGQLGPDWLTLTCLERATHHNHSSQEGVKAYLAPISRWVGVREPRVPGAADLSGPAGIIRRLIRIASLRLWRINLAVEVLALVIQF